MRTTASAPSRAPGNVQPTGRRWRAAARLCALVLVAALLSVAVGTRTIGPHALWTALLDAGLGSEDAVIVRQLRVPRTALGLLAGLALGIAGALLQGHTRNPLGDPGLLGGTAGASLAVVLAIPVLGVATPAGSVWFAFAGALAGTVAATPSAPRVGVARHPSPWRSPGPRSPHCSTLRCGPCWSATSRRWTPSASGSSVGWPDEAPTSRRRWLRSSPSAWSSPWPTPRP